MSQENEIIDRNSIVTLRKITKDTVRAILKLEVSEGQKNFVAPNAVSIAQAYFEENAWFRAIYADETPVGFLMLYDNSEKPIYYLWRLMIDSRYQNNGFGKRAVELLIEHVKTRPNATEILVSHGQGKGSPELFYRKLGFEHTGEVEGNELVMKRLL